MYKLIRYSIFSVFSSILFLGFSPMPVVNPPTITLDGLNPYILETGTAYVEPGAIADDPEEGTLTDKIIYAGQVNSNLLGNYYLQYSVTDSDSNTTTVEREVRVVATTAPTISPTGNTIVTLEVGTTYSDQGATATDNYDPAVNVVVGGDNVDTTTVGTYTVTYNASDSSGNAATQVTRTVNVVDTTAPTVTVNSANPLIISLGVPFLYQVTQLLTTAKVR